MLSEEDTTRLRTFFANLGAELHRVLVPGGHLFLASNPLLSTDTFAAISQGGLEKRGEVIRLVQTLRGGDRPKGAHTEFPDVTVMPRAGWEPWGLFRKPLDGTVAENLRAWGTGGLRRRSAAEPFRDVIPCAPTRPAERRLAPHPSPPRAAGLHAILVQREGYTLGDAGISDFRQVGVDELDRVESVRPCS